MNIFQRLDVLDRAVARSMQHIETRKLTADAASAVLSVPSGYRHLKLIGMVDNPSGAHGVDVQFNGDTGTNYAWVEDGWSSTSGATDTVSETQNSARIAVCYNQGTGGQSPFETTIFDYANTSFNKRFSSIYGAFEGGGRNSRQSTGFWSSTAVIVSITVLIDAGAANLKSGSSFSLYGLP